MTDNIAQRKLPNKTLKDLNKVRATLQRSKKAYRSFTDASGEDECVVLKEAHKKGIEKC